MKALDKLRWPLSSIAGLLVIVFYVVFMLISAAIFPTSWTPFPYLSDFGSSSLNPHGAVFYNLACILTGIMLFPFYIGLYKWYTKLQWRNILIMITQIIGVASGFSLIMIGVFNEDYMSAHVMWSDIFFFLNLLVLIFANVSLITHPSFIKPIAIYGFIVAAINFALVFITGSSIVEWFTVFTALAYAGLLVINMLKAFRPTSKGR